MRVKEVLRMIVWLAPSSSAKNRILCRLGDEIAATAVARSNLVSRVTTIRMATGSRIGRFNLLKNLRLVEIGEGSSIGRLNVISSHPVYKKLYPDGAALVIGSHTFITSRHQLDCSGSISLGDYSAIAGHETKILTHSIDVAKDVQVAYAVEIGSRSFVGARCLVLGGAQLPSHSVLAAGSVLTRSRRARQPGLWAGVPAKHRGEVSGEWFSRAQTGTSRVYIPATGETVENAI